MVRITKVYTRSGDQGKTSLGSGERVSKDSPRVEAYGTVDELNSVLGVLLCEEVPPALREELLRIQQELFDLGADLSPPSPSARQRARRSSRLRSSVWRS